jgi:hypothetical protein
MSIESNHHQPGYTYEEALAAIRLAIKGTDYRTIALMQLADKEDVRGVLLGFVFGSINVEVLKKYPLSKVDTEYDQRSNPRRPRAIPSVIGYRNNPPRPCSNDYNPRLIPR